MFYQKKKVKEGIGSESHIKELGVNLTKFWSIFTEQGKFFLVLGNRINFSGLREQQNFYWLHVWVVLSHNLNSLEMEYTVWW